MRYWILRWQEDNWMIVCQQHIPIVGGSYRSKGFKGLLRQIAGNWMWICPTVVFVAFNHIQLRQSYNAWWVPCLWWILNACWLVFDGLRLAIRFWTSARYSGCSLLNFFDPSDMEAERLRLSLLSMLRAGGGDGRAAGPGRPKMGW